MSLKPMDCVSWVSCIELIKENPIHFKEVDGESVVISRRRWGLIIQACIIFGFKPFFMAIEAELCWFELAYDIDLGFLWNFAFHI